MKFVKIVFFLIVIGLAAVAGGSYWLYNSLNSPHEHDKASQFIKIEKGSSPAEIVSKLNAEGILSNQLPIHLYLRLFGDAAKLQAETQPLGLQGGHADDLRGEFNRRVGEAESDLDVARRMDLGRG